MDPNNKSVTINVGGPCTGLFIDPNSTLYCSQGSFHRVVSTSLINNTNNIILVAGNNSSGTLSYMLNNPQGIFVDTTLTLYVADTNNNRVQRFLSGQKNGTTVAGNASSPPVSLNQPTGVILDGNGYLFIADCGNHRVVASSRNGFRCVAGCSGTGGAEANQLAYPRSLSFDSYGNIFVTDTNNSRVQKFMLATNSCCEY